MGIQSVIFVVYFVFVLFSHTSLCSKHVEDGIDLHTLCEYPVLHTTGRVAHAPTAMAQGMLNFAIHSDLQIDGIFGPATTAAVNKFEKIHNLDQDGVLDRYVWPVLINAASPLYRNATSPADLVHAVQSRLTSLGFGPKSGFPAPGSYDLITSQSVAIFQKSRGAAVIDGNTVNFETFHLLASDCNSSSLNDHEGFFFFDAGWPQGIFSVETLACLRQAGFKWATFECWREYSGWWQESATNVQNAIKAGFETVGVYVFPVRAWDPATQVPAILGNLTLHKVQYDSIMLDIEGPDWGHYSKTENKEFMQGLLKNFHDHDQKNIVVYCGPEWPDYFGSDFDDYSKAGAQLIYAHYDLVPSFYDWIDSPYGGWKSPSGKQFWDGQDQYKMCNTGALDWDWSPTPFWLQF